MRSEFVFIYLAGICLSYLTDNLYLMHGLLYRARGEYSKSTSSEPDCNDNLPSHHTPTSSSSSSKHASVNGFFPTQHVAGLYDSPPSRGQSLSTDSLGLYHLPRSYSQDTVLLPKSASSPHAPDGEPGELYVFNTPCRKPSLEAHLRNLSVSYDIPPTPGSNCTYQIPRTAGVEAVSGATDVVPPPRPPKPLLTTGTVPPERSPTDTYVVPRSVSETDGNYCVPSSTGGNKALRSNTIGTMDSSHLRKGRRISIIQVTCAISPSLWKQKFSNNTSSKSLEV